MYGYLEVEDWEIYPDNYDGAQFMQNRGRMTYLEYLYELEHHGVLSDQEERDPLLILMI